MLRLVVGLGLKRDSEPLDARRISGFIETTRAVPMRD
jgi:hypothetical protein